MFIGDLFKKRGCPNCKTEKICEVLSVDAFHSYKSLKHVKKVGNSTEVFFCKECNSKYIRVNNGHLLHMISPRYESMFEKFSEDQSIRLKALEDKLVKLEANDIFENHLTTVFEKIYTCSVRLKNGESIDQALLVFKNSIWPIAEGHEDLKFVDEIEEVFFNEQSLSKEQKEAMIMAPEIRMGVAPIWLEKDSHLFMMLQGNYFIPKNLGRAADFKLLKGHGKPEQIIESGKIQRFLGRL